MNILITGAAGFIGYNLCLNLLNDKKKKYIIYGIDNFDDYYSKKIKKSRISELKKFKNFIFYKIDITDKKKIINFFKNKYFKIAFHFAAQAGVRYSIVNPQKYIDVNIKGFVNILNCMISSKTEKIFYASSSSVYGDTKKFPSNEKDTLNPKNIYAMTKVFNENYAEQFSKDYKIKLIGLRFFTVYGEFSRPDMLIGKLIGNINKKKKFNINNKGNHVRDFTYIKDACLIINKLMQKKITKNHDIFNICSNNPINITNVINKIIINYGKTKISYVKINKLDVLKTHGDNSKILKLVGNINFTNINKGVLNTISWFKKKKITKNY